MTKILKEQVKDLQDYNPKFLRLARSLAANPDSADASLLADFGRKGYGVGDDEGINKAVSFAELFTFTRASDKTAIDNASGLLVTVPANEPAFSWSSAFGGRKPLTIHGARTNLFQNSGWAGAVSGTVGTPPTNWINGSNSGYSGGSASSYLNSVINFIDYKDFAATDEQLIEWSTI